ncbi:AAA family ATPase [Bacillus massiliglaciei]|uniref:AAA family ATPase n=1 Tax=Bacillus massiliglaciei TaxID=1816693 RepID=UPI000B11025F|nr:AAA family ATPase [Bacillus massiliglaciei]
MKIKELHIYGYGKLENERFTDLKQLQVFAGKNESGKSTIMSFIQSMLFGFPTKAQHELRYEPKQHAKYGGALVLESKEYGEIHIERVKGKAAGDVKVTFANGETAGEEGLERILQGMDKPHYQSVYSFNLDGLAQVSSINEKELGKYLLSAGLFGNDRLTDVEAKLQKELDKRFKPSGQKPELNIKLKKTRALNERLKAAESEQSVYSALLDERKNIEKKLAGLMEEFSQTEKRLMEQTEFLRMKPLLEKKKEIEERIGHLKDGTDFPANGLRKLEQIQSALIPLHSQRKALLENKRRIEEKLADNEILPYIRDNKEAIETSMSQSAFFDKLELDIKTLEMEMRSNRREIERVKQTLHLNDETVHILQLDTSTFMKEKIKKLERKLHRLRDTKMQLDQKYGTQKDKLEAAEKRVAELQSKLLPNDKREQLENQRAAHENETYRTLKKQLLDDQIKELEQASKRNRNFKQANHRLAGAISWGIVFLFILMAVWSFLKSNELAGAALMAAAVMMAVLRPFKNPSGQEMSLQISNLKKKREELESRTPGDGGTEWQSAERLLENEKEIRRLLAAEKTKLSEREQAFEVIIQEYEEWEQAWLQVNDDVTEVLAAWGLSGNSAEIPLETAFELLVNWKTLLEKNQDMTERHHLLKKDFEKRIEELLCHGARLRKGLQSWKEAVFHVQKALKEAAAQQNQTEHLREQNSQAEEELAKLQAEIEFLDREIQKLFVQAAVESEEEFRSKAKRAEEFEELLKQAEVINIQLRQSRLTAEQMEDFWDQDISSYTVNSLESQRESLQSRRTELLEKRSELKHHILKLETAGTYDEILHQFHEEKASFNEESKEWAVFALAKEMLERTLEQFKKERLPNVIKKATEYFSMLTEGEYIKIVFNQETEALQAVRKDRQLFDASEVSRGTAEQIYVSLRLALAAYSFEKDPFPMIIDDSFVNFDSVRAGLTIRLLKEIAQKHQIIFFTCHEHMLQHFSRESVIVLGESSFLINR